MIGDDATDADGLPAPQGPESSTNVERNVHVSPLVKAVLKRSLDQAFKSAGVTVAPPKEQALVERVSKEVTVAFEQTVFQGPMPPPKSLGEYDQILPGLAKQIADMALSEQRHRHRWERRALWNDIFAQSGGLALGWVLAAGCATGAFYLAMTGNNIGAGILLSVVVVSLVKTFTGIGAKQMDASSPPNKHSAQNPSNPQEALTERD